MDYLQGRLKVCGGSLICGSRKFRWNFEEVEKVFQGCFKDVSRMFQDSRMFHGCFKGVLRNCLGCCCYMKVWRVLQERLKSDLRAYHVSFKDISKKFKGYFEEVSKVVQASFRGDLRVFQGS